MKIILYVFFINLAFLTSCVVEPLTAQLVEEGVDEDKSIDVPCTYDDYVEVDGWSGMKDDVDVDHQESFDYDEAVLRFYSSDITLVFKYNDRLGFDAIKVDEIFDLSKSYNMQVRLIRYGSFGFTYRANQGNVYCQRLANGDLKIDWCDIVIDGASSSTYYSRGGFTIIN